MSSRRRVRKKKKWIQGLAKRSRDGSSPSISASPISPWQWSSNWATASNTHFAAPKPPAQKGANPAAAPLRRSSVLPLYALNPRGVPANSKFPQLALNVSPPPTNADIGHQHTKIFPPSAIRAEPTLLSAQPSGTGSPVLDGRPPPYSLVAMYRCRLLGMRTFSAPAK